MVIPQNSRASYILQYLSIKKTDEFIVESPDEPGRKTGKKINKWMLNSLTKKIK